MEKLKNLITFTTFIILWVLMIFLNTYVFGSKGSLTPYGILLLIYLTLKMSLSFFYRPYKGKVGNYKVAAIIPSYNEDGESLLETLKSVQSQTYPIAEIFVVDDGSADKTGIKMIEDYIANNPDATNVIAHRLPENVGKRHAQAWAFSRSDADVFLTVDSDSYIYPDALEELLKSFNDKDVYAATGHLNARNRDVNLLTILTDIRYDNAFGVERAAQSVTGNILVCSGPLSVYRREVVVPNIERYTSQTFLGIPVSIGDDRCLTNYATDLGKTVYQSTARCDTDVPFNFKTYLKQQNRWNKSFFRESIISVKKMMQTPLVAVWTVLEVSMFIMLLYSVLDLFVGEAQEFNGLKILAFLTLIFLVALCRNIHYMVKHPLAFLLSPIYGILHLFVLQPLRLYSLFTIRNADWGTRKAEEEEPLT
ncbi:glycosyltransferase [Streptococcus iniae]|uniref:glycosyltransferase family 2 protein n=1 Tax=Streptococcus iniae TaxID=1346 RepID=UPI0008D94000|nr:glycosyltransferase [Streptococcus iniae]OHX27700.1 hyaluronan synthase [Streptococcus iniae]RLV26998.1 glycosyltransferase [Streptococcus iniae]